MTEELELKSLVSITSKSIGSTIISRSRYKNVPLHERCSIGNMIEIKDAFEKANMNKLLPNQFRDLIRELLDLEYDDDEYHLLFLKINTNRDGEICWDELVSFLMTGYFGEDEDNQLQTMQLNIVGLPVMMRSHHRHQISRICFCPDINKDRTKDPLNGLYITASRDGMINWWSLDMVLLRSAYSISTYLKLRTTWVTDMVCMPDLNIIVTSSTERELRFYDCTADNFTLKIVITSWEYMDAKLQKKYGTGQDFGITIAAGS